MSLGRGQATDRERVAEREEHRREQGEAHEGRRHRGNRRREQQRDRAGRGDDDGQLERVDPADEHVRQVPQAGTIAVAARAASAESSPIVTVETVRTGGSRRRTGRGPPTRRRSPGRGSSSQAVHRRRQGGPSRPNSRRRGLTRKSSRRPPPGSTPRGCVAQPSVTGRGLPRQPLQDPLDQAGRLGFRFTVVGRVDRLVLVAQRVHPDRDHLEAVGTVQGLGSQFRPSRLGSGHLTPRDRPRGRRGDPSNAAPLESRASRAGSQPGWPPSTAQSVAGLCERPRHPRPGLVERFSAADAATGQTRCDDRRRWCQTTPTWADQRHLPTGVVVGNSGCPATGWGRRDLSVNRGDRVACATSVPTYHHPGW